MLTIGSLCSGMGGLDLAVEAHFRTQPPLWVSETNKSASEVLLKRLPNTPNLGDITDNWSGEPVDILTAGYPCQPFSHAGLRKGIADERHLWPAIQRIITELRPQICVFENVPGHKRIGGRQVVGALTRLGYSVKWGIVRASDAGAPHKRSRLFIVAKIPNTYSGRSRSESFTSVLGKLDSKDEGSSQKWERAREKSGNRSVETITCPNRQGLQGRSLNGGERSIEPYSKSSSVGFGPYTAAIRRWESIIGRSAPSPTEEFMGRHRLSPIFVEWMMGLPAGWVTDVSISHVQQLKILGNGVVPQQAQLALRLLSPISWRDASYSASWRHA